MSGNKEKQRRWGVDKHPVFAVQKTDILTGIKVRLEIFRMDILEMWYVSLFHGMYISFYRVKQNISQLIVIIPGLFEPPVRTLRATIPDANSHFPRPAGPHFPASQGHIKRPA